MLKFNILRDDGSLLCEGEWNRDVITKEDAYAACQASFTDAYEELKENGLCEDEGEPDCLRLQFKTIAGVVVKEFAVLVQDSETDVNFIVSWLN